LGTRTQNIPETGYAGTVPKEKISNINALRKFPGGKRCRAAGMSRPYPAGFTQDMATAAEWAKKRARKNRAPLCRWLPLWLLK
jgi:hypothetical protein